MDEFPILDRPQPVRRNGRRQRQQPQIERDRVRPRRRAAVAAIDAIRDLNLNNDSDDDMNDDQARVGLCELDNFVENFVQAHTLDPMNQVCEHCSALTFSKESRGFCCSNGRKTLEQFNQPPPALLELFQTPNFRKNIRKYNQAFAFTSLGVAVDEDLANGRDGVYTFRIHGELCHRIGSLMPADGEPESYGQIYFLDANNQAERRGNIFQDLNNQTLIQIGAIMNEVNPFAQIFKNAGEYPS